MGTASFSLSLKGSVRKKSGYRAQGQGMRSRSLLKRAEERIGRNKEGSAARGGNRLMTSSWMKREGTWCIWRAHRREEFTKGGDPCYLGAAQGRIRDGDVSRSARR